jgi:hypothetical protein
MRTGVDRAFSTARSWSLAEREDVHVTQAGFRAISAYFSGKWKQVSLTLGQIAIGENEDEGNHGTRCEVTFGGVRVRMFRR